MILITTENQDTLDKILQKLVSMEERGKSLDVGQEDKQDLTELSQQEQICFLKDKYLY